MVFNFKVILFVPQMSKHLNDITKGIIIGLRSEGFKLKDIAEKVKKPMSTISKFLSSSKKRDNCKRKEGSGRKPLLDQSNLNKIRRIIEKNPKTSSKKIKKCLKLPVTSRTVRRVLNQMSFYGRVAVKNHC